MKPALFLSTLIILGVLSLSVGCGEGSTPVPETTTSVTDLLKQDLGYIIENKSVGSEIETIKANIESLQESNAELATKLNELLPKLESSRSSSAVAAAKDMLKAVEGS